SASATFANASYTFSGSGVGLDNGVHTFTNGATLFTAGTKTLSATDASIPATGSQTVSVRPGNAVSMAVGGFPSVVKAGGDGSFLVQLIDSWGNIATGFVGSVTLTSSNALPVFPVANPYTFTPADAGQHTFTVALGAVSPGSSITATSGALTASQTGIIVQP